ncbi:hypothetical protein [Streptomyces sp. NPDC050560]|uniref:hypothetical protein n=1 Tax=Streptomyces sp. NPDC050560 TaxID=3365630 RepID=UPI0037B2800A
MPLSYRDLMDVDLGPLGTAVGDWKTAVDHLSTLADSARDGLKAKADSAKWAGVNAGVTRGFVARTAKEFRDLHGEAKSVFDVLDDAHRELVTLQKSVTSLVHEAEGRGLVVKDNGDTTVTVTQYAAPGEPAKEDLEKQTEHYAAQITSKVGQAEDIDQSVKLALGRIHGKDAYNAGHHEYGSLNDAQAERAIELANRGDKMTDAQFRELNRLLKYNGGARDGEFATDFFKGLGGPRKTLEFYAEMATDGTADNAGKTRLDLARQLQRNMGMTLATATDPDNREHLSDSWGAQFRRLGTRQIAWVDGQMYKPLGYQVLGGMLRYGDYDARFINPVAEHITQLHDRHPDMFDINREVGGSDAYGFNPSGKLGKGQDPLSGVLEGLGHSPAAATAFFHDEPTPYDDNGSEIEDGKVGYRNYLNHFTDENFKWSTDNNEPFPAANGEKSFTDHQFGPTALGHALEAATTGRAYDDDSGPAIMHGTQQAALVGQLVDKFGEHPELIRHDLKSGADDEGSGPLWGMRESLGDITAEYMGDFQRGVVGGTADHFPSFGEQVEINPERATAFLGEVGQDPHAYASITSAQQAYTANIVDHVLNDPSETRVDPSERLRNGVEPGGMIAGIMSQARSDAVVAHHAAADSAFNDAAADKMKWADRLLGMGIDKGAEKVPILGPSIGWAKEDLEESILKSVAADSADDAARESSEEYHGGRNAVIASTRSIVETAAGDRFSDASVSDFQDSAVSGASAGFNSGVNAVNGGDAK